MKKTLFLRLCLILMVALTAYSCRTELLSEADTYENGTKFHLTSRRISLNEAKHKQQLSAGLEEAEARFKEIGKVNLNGRTVNYANGVSINTKSVIYIENGDNFHTYTFHIQRQNAPDNAPLENLLLVPETDGSYREFLVTYHLTAQEKEKIKNGEPVNTKGKTKITELAKGSFNSGGALMNAKTTCSWTDVTIVYGCSQINKSTGQPVHNASNMSDWHNCTAETKPMVFTAGVWNCVPEKEDNYISPGTGGGGSGGGGENTDPGTPPNECTSVATDPTQVGLIGSDGCNIGMPSQPNNSDDPDERTPCEVLKENSETPYIQTKLDSLKERVALTTTGRDHHETAITIAKRGAALKHKVFTKPKETGIAGVIAVEIGLHPWDILAAHNHYEDTFPVPQFGDILTFYTGYKISDPARKNAYTNYVVNFNGTEYAFRMSDTTALDALLAGLNQDTRDPTTTEQEEEANNSIYKIFRAKGFEKDKDYTEEEALKILMKVLNDSNIGSGNGVHLYRKNNTNRWAKLKLNPDGTVGKDDCPL
ncbi:hypothetical protein OF897_20155 [Chryseobacterium formosus]|uniref:Uncharacterized protein n=1 Tax=Chryseobacterium formosus TaxID=1537363 RepID=A0ABT3XX26_9FLAO|nr:hypothetical protein [Chryseobacterium formosus]MCX8526233.1 hypothetical protein [Chryseobacterium formosus]